MFRFDVGQDALLGWSPYQFRGLRADHIEPCEFPGWVPVVALGNLADPFPVSTVEPTRRPGNRKAEVFPCFAVGRVFKDATPLAKRCHSRSETAAIIAGPLILPGGGPLAEPSPPFTGRVRDNRERSRVEPRVPSDVPRIDAWLPEVTTVFLNEQGSDQKEPRKGVEDGQWVKGSLLGIC
jgi:hypothetical protein